MAPEAPRSRCSNEGLCSLDDWRASAPANRFTAEVVALRALAQSGHLDALDEPLDRFSEFVGGLDSKGASCWLAEIHGTVARMRYDWVGAAHWYRKATELGEGQLRTWFDLTAAWHLLRSGGP